MLVNGSARCEKHSLEHAHQRGFAAAGRAEQSDDLSRIDRQVDGRNDLNAAAVRLGIVLLQLASFDDRFGRCIKRRVCVCSAHARVYYRSTVWQAHASAGSIKVRFPRGYNDMNAK